MNGTYGAFEGAPEDDEDGVGARRRRRREREDGDGDGDGVAAEDDASEDGGRG